MKEPSLIPSNCSWIGLGANAPFPVGSCPSAWWSCVFTCNFTFSLCLQRKEWTWDESKMVVMHDPVYRYAAGVYTS